MKYMLNSNYKRISAGEYTFMIDITEKEYGRSKPVLYVNSSTLHVLDLLKKHSKEEVLNILLNEGDHSCSEEELRENIVSTIEVLRREHVIFPEQDSIDTSVTHSLEKVGFGAVKGPLGKLRKPLIGVVEITSLCNCNCPHCYVKGLDNSKQISTEKMLKIASLFKSKGILNVTITGGEPLLHPDFKDIYMEFKKQGFLIDVFTNALLINEEIASFFAKNPPRSLDITLYGTSNEEYYRFTGIKNGYNDLCNALELLEKNGIFFSTKMILNNNNYTNLEKYNQIAVRYHAPFRYNVLIGQGNNTVKDPTELMLSNDQIIEIEKRDPIKMKVFQDIVSKCNNLPYDCNEEEGWSQYICGAGLDKVFIGYDGKMSPCMTLRNKGLDLFEHGFDYIWDYWGEQRKRKLSRNFKCIGCKYLPICTPCTEEFEQVNKDREQPIESRCDLAQKRWNLFIENNNNK